jgi:hypothetical protein
MSWSDSDEYVEGKKGWGCINRLKGREKTERRERTSYPRPITRTVVPSTSGAHTSRKKGRAFVGVPG